MKNAVDALVEQPFQKRRVADIASLDRQSRICGIAQRIARPACQDDFVYLFKALPLDAKRRFLKKKPQETFADEPVGSGDQISHVSLRVILKDTYSVKFLRM
jgi:hypothetical protein